MLKRKIVSVEIAVEMSRIKALLKLINKALIFWLFCIQKSLFGGILFENMLASDC